MFPGTQGAILICTEAHITDPKIKALYHNIIRSQSQDAGQMNAVLERKSVTQIILRAGSLLAYL